MSQYDFGTIDPYVVDGVQLADMLNQWRDAVHSWHRGASRPSYIVPGQMWINDAGGATNWIVNVYISPTVGDLPVFTYNTTAGTITVSAAAGGTLAAAILLAQAAAAPSVRWNATSNPIDAKAWRATVDAAGALVLSSYTDAGVLQQSFTFNRDGTTTNLVPPNTMRLYAETVLASANAEMRVNVPAGAKAIELWFSTINSGNVNDTLVINALNGAAIQNSTVYLTQYFYGSGAAASASVVAGATAFQVAAGVVRGNGIFRPIVEVGGVVSGSISGYAGNAAGTTFYALASGYVANGLATPTGYRLSNTAATTFITGSFMRCLAVY